MFEKTHVVFQKKNACGRLFSREQKFGDPKAHLFKQGLSFAQKKKTGACGRLFSRNQLLGSPIHKEMLLILKVLHY